MYVMLCGRMTPTQKQIMQRRVNMDAGEYFDILNWFITESAHSGYTNLPLPKFFPLPCFVPDESTENNTDEPRNEEAEK